MVKPPKTMQPEGCDLQKAGRATGQAFQEDSFHHYMARKIDLQRQQFGLVLPPDPRDMNEEHKEENPTSTSEAAAAADILQRNSSHSSGEVRSAIRFAQEIAGDANVDIQHLQEEEATLTDPPSLKRTTTSKQSGKKKRSSKNKDKSTCLISAVVKRLKRRHGRVLRLRQAETASSDDTETETPTLTNEACNHSLQQQLQQQQEESTTMDGTSSSSIDNHLVVVQDKHNSNNTQIPEMETGQHESALRTSSSTTTATAAKTTAAVQKKNSEKKTTEMDSEEQEATISTSCAATTITTTTTRDNVSEAATAVTTTSPTLIKRMRPDLFFLGIVVFVNGYTNPDTETLQRLLHKHGGDLEKYETSRITHILAEQLSTAKANVYKRQRKPLPVCKPSWIVDSVRAQQQLPYGNYLLDQVRNVDNGIRSVAFFFQTNACTTAANTNTQNDVPAREPTDTLGSNEKEVAVGQISRKDNANNTDADAFPIEPQRAGDSDGDDILESGVTERTDADVAAISSRESNVAVRGDQNTDSAESATTEREDEASSSFPPALAESCALDRKKAAVVLPTCNKSQGNNSAGAGFPAVDRNQSPTGTSSRRTDDKYINGRVRTVGTDPNFLETYFNSSRLSFIGSFKLRARPSPTRMRAAPKNKEGTSKRFVFHVDMDAFFCSVVLRNFPEYRDKPVAISHNGQQRASAEDGNKNCASSAVSRVTKDSTSECATCNYEARRFGIKKGMFLGRAKQLCPDLVVLQYDFDGYEEVSEQVAEILFRVAAEYDGSVEQVSCDEAYMEVHIADDDSNNLGAEGIAQDLASSIRQEIFEQTKCTASIGVATNKLLAKLGTDRVKPNGQLLVRDYRELLGPLQLRDLHGIGYRLDRKLAEEDLRSVQEVWDLGSAAEAELIRILGAGTGKKIFAFCCGKDDRPISPAERKTIGAECSYGVRFNGPYGVEHMVAGLAQEVAKRMTLVGVKGSKVTLKIKQRVENAPPPQKYLGHGHCSNLSKSRDTREVTRNWKVISRHCNDMLTELGVQRDDVRGMGIIISKLTPGDGQAKAGPESKQSLRNFFKEAAAPSKDPPLSEKRVARDTTNALQDEERTKPSSDNENSTPSGVDNGAESSSSVILNSESAMHECSISAARRSTSGFQDEQDLDIALPALSQIRMSQVELLPSPMRKGALSRIEKEKAARAAPNAKAVSPLEKPTRFRQTDVKRMLQLATVKSGHVYVPQATGEGMSLTQLETLPLEMQLQVVNDDNIRLGTLSPTKPQNAKKRARVQERAAGGGKARRRNATNPGCRPAAGHQAAEHETAKMQVEMDLPSFSPRDIFRDDVYPLGIFLDENPGAGSDAMEQVKDFLLLCVGENRLPDVVVLLRSIKNREDRWSDDPFDWLLERVNDAIALSHGMKLDSGWLLQGRGAM